MAVRNPIITLRFKFQRQTFVAGLYDAAIDEDVDEIRHDVVQQPLIMSNDELGIISALQLVHAMRDNF